MNSSVPKQEGMEGTERIALGFVEPTSSPPQPQFLTSHGPEMAHSSWQWADLLLFSATEPLFTAWLLPAPGVTTGAVVSLAVRAPHCWTGRAPAGLLPGRAAGASRNPPELRDVLAGSQQTKCP